jgi:hypothetical protein
LSLNPAALRAPSAAPPDPQALRRSAGRPRATARARLVLLTSVVAVLAATWAGGAADGPVVITNQPANARVFVGDPATFTVGVDGTPPFGYQWFRESNPLAGATQASYTLPVTTLNDDGAVFAVRVDNESGTVMSSNAVLSIDPGTAVERTNSYLVFTSSWRYNQTANLDGVNWQSPAYNDSAWPSGAGLLYVEDASLPATKSTPLTLGRMTYYFRARFTVTNAAPTSIRLQVGAIIDDGAVFYLNGAEVLRLGVPVGQNYNTSASRTVGDAAYEGPFEIPATNLVTGTNVLAVEVHQVSSTSSDIVFGMTLDGAFTERIRDTFPPTVASLIPPAGATVYTLTQVEVLFSEPVEGVDAADLRVNGSPASGLRYGLPGQFVFEFPQPATGLVQVAWSPAHGIRDLSAAANPFAGGGWTYTLDTNASRPRVVINEFLASNSGLNFRDEDGDSSDWIELYNWGTTAVDLRGWALTDTTNNLMKWRFPTRLLEAGRYLVVFASDKNRTNVSTAPFTNFHTNFKLAAGGGYLGLVDPQGNPVSEFYPAYPPQQTDVSYGRDQYDLNLLGYFQTPTPWRTNAVSGAGFAPEVQFSRPSGTFPATLPFQLTLSTDSTNAVIYYLLGTNTPGTNSTRYTGPISVNGSTLIRARAYQPGLFPGPVASRTYLALSSDVLAFNSDLPLMILHNFGQGALPTSKAEHHVVVQTFEPVNGRASMTNAPALAERGIFHLRGSSTVGYAKGSFFLEVRDEANNDKEVPLLGLPEESDWVLYAPNNFEPALFHNPLAYQLSRDIGRYASRTRFVEVYLKDDSGTPGAITSGDYNGIYVLEEKIKRDNNRVDIDKLEPEHVRQPEITGGYLLSIDRGDGTPTLSAGGATMNWIDPDGVTMSAAARAPQLTYIRDYFNSFASVLNGANWTNPVTGYAAWIDVQSWLDHSIHNVVTFNVDALRLSGYFYKPRSQGINMGPVWDFDRTQGSTDGRDFYPRTWRSQSGDLGTDFFNFSPWWNRLFTDPDFWQGWIDRYQELRLGPLSTNNILARIDQFAGEVRLAQPREQARWGITPRAASGSGAGTYETEVQFKKNWYSNRLDFMDGQFLAPPTLSSPGGPIAPGFAVTLRPASEAGSWVIYTLDGTDPRWPGGGIAAGALSNLGPAQVVLSNNVRVVARSFNPAHRNLTGANNPPLNSIWSGPVAGTFYTAVPPLRITEIMYHPPPPPAGNTNDPDNFEYVEIRNTGSTPLNLNRFRLRGGLELDFTNKVLAAGEYAVVVADTTAFRSRYGTNGLIVGQYTRRLDNGGETLVLEGPLREPILDFRFEDNWYRVTDGLGFSLVIVNDALPTASWGLKSSWRPSGRLHGSPGAADPAPPALPVVLVNEVLSHTDPPVLDTVELYNASAGPADICGWFLTDDRDRPTRYTFPAGTVIGAGNYLLVSEAQFNPGGSGFGLSSQGDDLWLFSGDGTNLTGYTHGFDFGPSANGDTFGRHVISTGEDHFPVQTTPTLGGPNAGPRVGPVIIGEIMYHPPDLLLNGRLWDNTQDEFIELRNTTSSPVSLFDTNYPTNTWRLTDAVEFQFPPNVTMPPLSHLLVVSFDPADTGALQSFRNRNGVSAGVPIYGPFAGKLANDQNSVELRRPDVPQMPPAPDAGLVPYLLVERVRYADDAPWPGAADGYGPSLQRVAATGYGNDPTNWVAAPPSPGAPYGGGVPPTITTHPTNLTVIGYNTAVFAVEAAGTPPFSYRWTFDGVTLAGATNATLVLSNVQVAQAGVYRVLVGNGAGAALSSNALLTVIRPVTITAHPQNTYVLLGTSATLAVTATSDSPISYQWLRSGTNLPGANGPTLSFPNVQLADVGDYAVRVWDAVSSLVSSNASLQVLINPVILSQPQGQTVAEGAPLTLSVTISNPVTWPVSYRWRRGGTTLTNFMLTQDHSELVFSSVRTNDADRYTVVVTNVAAALLSAPAPVTVVVPPAAQVVAAGTNVTFAVRAFTGVNTPVRFQWRFGGEELSGATNTTLTLTNVTADDQGTYAVTVEVPTNNVAPATFAASLTVLGGDVTLSQPQVLSNGAFQMLLEGLPGRDYLLEISPDLTNWTTLRPITYTNGLMPVVDDTATNAAQRFYRARSTP